MGFSIILGLNSALDTLISQSAGAGNIVNCGVLLNRARFITTVMFLPLVIIAYQIESVLLYFAQEPEVAFYTQIFIKAYLPAMYFRGINMCQVHFLNNLGKTRVPMMAQMLGSLLHPVWCYILVSHLKMSILGIGIAGVLTNAVVLVFNFVYTFWLEDLQEAVFCPDERCFAEVYTYLELGLPSAFSYSLDVWANCLFRFLAGYTGIDGLSA
jgi:MATE family multidrug resistance protein